MRRSVLFGLVVAALIGAVVMFRFFRSDESRIRARLEQLADAVRVDRGSSGAARALRIQNEFNEIFTEDATAKIDELEESIEGRPALVLAATEIGGSKEAAAVSFGDVSLRLHGDAAEAKVIATLTGLSREQRALRDRVRVTITLKKIDGDWKIASAIVSPRPVSSQGQEQALGAIGEAG